MRWRAWLNALLARLKKETPPMTLKQVPLPYDEAYYHGQYSYLNNSKAIGSRGGGSSSAAMFPAGYTDNVEDTIYKNTVEGKWLPFWIPSTADGHVGNGLPEIIFYAVPQISDQFDAEFGPAHSSPEGDEKRWVRAHELGLQAASSTSGAPHLVVEE